MCTVTTARTENTYQPPGMHKRRGQRGNETDTIYCPDLSRTCGVVYGTMTNIGTVGETERRETKPKELQEEEKITPALTTVYTRLHCTTTCLFVLPNASEFAFYIRSCLSHLHFKDFLVTLVIHA